MGSDYLKGFVSQPKMSNTKPVGFWYLIRQLCNVDDDDLIGQGLDFGWETNLH